MDYLDLHWVNEEPELGIVSEGVYCKDMPEIIGHIAETKDTVKKINLNNQRTLKEIPTILGMCKLLEELDISHTTIREIPDFLFELPNLRVLSCCCIDLASFPKGISKAAKLENLHIRINNGWKFPEEICSLKSLKVLIVDLHSAAALPDKMGDLESLEELNLAIKYDEGDVPSLPASLSNHKALKKLTINDPFYKTKKNFDLASAAQILSSCSELESLKLSGIAVGEGHHGISSLNSLKDLELRHLLIEGEVNIFDSIAGLQKLEKLDIWGSEFKLYKIPDIFNNLKELHYFSIAGNMVLELPPSIYTLEKLVSLEIGSTGISKLDEKISNLQNLENIQIYDNILEALPDSIFNLTHLKVLNIEENIFSAKEIASIKEKLKALDAKGQKVELMFDRQGHKQMVKRLRALGDVDKMDIVLYTRYCLNAVKENPYAIKYVNKFKLNDSKYYTEICITAVRKTCFALENVDISLLAKGIYFYVCMEAAHCPNIGNGFKLIKDDLLTDDEYMQICIEAALHNKSASLLENFNTTAFKARFDRSTYEKICWVAVLHYPPVISKMENPTDELRAIVSKRVQH